MKDKTKGSQHLRCHECDRAWLQSLITPSSYLWFYTSIAGPSTLGTKDIQILLDTPSTCYNTPMKQSAFKASRFSSPTSVILRGLCQNNRAMDLSDGMFAFGTSAESLPLSPRTTFLLLDPDEGSSQEQPTSSSTSSDELEAEASTGSSLVG